MVAGKYMQKNRTPRTFLVLIHNSTPGDMFCRELGGSKPFHFNSDKKGRI
jgi:hypothetical protein